MDVEAASSGSSISTGSLPILAKLVVDGSILREREREVSVRRGFVFALVSGLGVETSVGETVKERESEPSEPLLMPRPVICV